MPRRHTRGGAKATLLRMGSPKSRKPDDARALPGFSSARAPKHAAIPGRGRHKAKPGRY